VTVSTVVVTGGNGQVGRVVLDHLAGRGYDTINVSRGSRREAVADRYVRVDLLDAGEVYATLSSIRPDAVVHLGMVPRPTDTPGHRTYESNALTTYHVLEAASVAGVKAVVVASSINVLGAAYQAAPTDLAYLPVDEAHPVTPRDPYGLGKEALEAAAAGVARRPDAPARIAVLRLPWIASTDDLRERYAGADRSLAGIEAAGRREDTRDLLFSYLHAADAARLVERSITADYAGCERFWAVAADTSTTTSTADLLDRCYPDVQVRSEFEPQGHEALISTAKARDLLGWSPEHVWRELKGATE
jgi:nucleoside-diphosphate-sugar epimerase